MSAFRFTDLPRVAADAKRYGIHEVVPWGWCIYVALPIMPRPELGTEAELLQGILRSREMGVNIAPFISVGLIRNRDAARYGVPLGTQDWTYHPDLIPMFRPYYTKGSELTEVSTNNPLWEHDVIAAFRDWIDKGMTSFSMDMWAPRSQGNERPGLLTTTETIRRLARAKDPQSTFSGETASHIEWESQVLDYTWDWLDYEDAAPITTVLRSPRLNCNVESSPRVVKKCFADDLFLNVMPRKLDQPNGTALISDKLDLAAALLMVAKLRREFLPYFVSGTFIGDSVLAQPSEGFVRGYQLDRKLLVIALNTDDQRRILKIHSNLALWLPQAQRYKATCYNTDGKNIDEISINQARWVVSTRKLNPDEFAFFEIQAK